MTDFPTIGLKTDLNEIVALKANLASIPPLYADIATAATAAAVAETARAGAGKAAGAAATQAATTEAAATKKKVVDEDAAQTLIEQMILDRRLLEKRLMDANMAANAAALAQEVQDEAAANALRQQMLLDQQVIRARAADARVATEAAENALIEQMISDQQIYRAKVAAQAAAVAQKQADEEVKAANKARAAQEAFLASLNRQIVSKEGGASALAAMKAEELGVAAEAAPLVAQLENIEKGMTKAAGSTALFTREFVVGGREIARGDFSRLAGTLTIEAQALGLLHYAFTPVGIAIIATIGLLAALGVAMYQGAAAASALDNALVVTGGYAGVVSDQVSAMATDIAASTNTSVLSTQKVLGSLISTGKFTADELGLATDIAERFSEFTGQSADKIAAQFEGMKGGVVKFAVKWEEAYHDLSLAQIDHINLLEKEGDHHGAELAFFQDVATSIHTKAEPAYYGLAGVIHNVTNEAKDMWAALMNIGAPTTLQDRINQTSQDLADTMAGLPGLAGGAKSGQNLQDRAQAARAHITALQDQLRAELDIQHVQQTAAAARAAAAEAEDNKIRAKYDNRSKKDPKGGSLDGAINAIERMRAEVSGLQAQVDSVSADPLAEMAAQIIKAGDVAAASRTAGKGSTFQDEARVLGQQKEELTLRLQMLDAAAKATRQSDLETQQATLEGQAHETSAKALQAYYQTARDSYQGLQAALDKQRDILLQAKLAQDALSIAQKFGVDHLDEIAVALMVNTGMTAQAAIQQQEAAQREYASAAARDKNAAAIATEADRTDKLTAAQQAQHDQQAQLNLLVDQSNLTSTQREVNAQALVNAATLLTQATKNQVALSNEDALAQGQILALMDRRIKDAAQLKVTIQDSIKQAFVDTGNLDFSSLKQGVLQALRKTIYEAFLEKPIDIVVNAAVNFETQLLQDAISSIFKGGSGGSGGLGNLISSALGGGGGGFGNSEEASAISSSLGSAAKSIGGAASQLAAVAGPFIAVAAADAALGAGLAKIAGGDARQQKNATIGGALLGVVGAVIGFLVGKESNHGAIASFNAAGDFVGVTGDKRNADTTAAVTTVAQSVATEISNLKQIGINAANVIKSIDLGSRDATHINLVSGQTINSPLGDGAALQDALEKALLRGATYTNAQEQKLVDQMLAANATLDEINTALQGFQQAQTDFQSVTLGLLKFTDPTQYALQTLQQQQLARRQTLKDEITSGFFTQDQINQLAQTLPQLEQKEIQDALANVASSANGAAHSLADFAAEQAKLADFLKSLNAGPLSPLSPADALAAQRSIFQGQLTSAQGGNFTALQGISGTAQTYLQQAQQFFGSGAAYAQVFQDVSASLAALSTQGIGVGGIDPQTDAINKANDDLQAAIAAASLQIVNAIANNDNGPIGGTTPSAANNNGALFTQAQLDQIIAALAASTEAMAGVNSAGLNNIANQMGSAATIAMALSGGGVAA